ncbi:MAG: helix-turn-helix transcriptional regulator [Clostridia bacterium]|nr:helix-turn-helix transcriptional regulator [Clostridia bacterium]MBR2375287.1 helix-turn-helix transcriptional regulator [Clostridia bacterium]
MKSIKFAERLKGLRQESCATQSQLADALRTTQRRISYLESGKVEPDLQLLWEIADFFDVSVDFLIGKTEM